MMKLKVYGEECSNDKEVSSRDNNERSLERRRSVNHFIIMGKTVILRRTRQGMGNAR